VSNQKRERINRGRNNDKEEDKEKGKSSEN
jgi:hypothetical protein